MTITRIKRWVNSHAIRIPKNILESMNLSLDSLIEITQSSDGIMLTPVKRFPTLEDLLLQVTSDNIHHEIDTGGAVGAEAW